MASGLVFPPLPLEEWEDTKETLHRFAQIAVKVRLESSPHRNHWWQVPLYVSTRGLTTGPIPYGNITFEISFDLMDNRLAVSTSEGGNFAFHLDDMPVAEFYRRLFEGLRTLGIEVSINTRPFDLDDEQTLAENTFHCVCDRDHVRRYWRVLVQVVQTFKEFAGRFNSQDLYTTDNTIPLLCLARAFARWAESVDDLNLRLTILAAVYGYPLYKQPDKFAAFLEGCLGVLFDPCYAPSKAHKPCLGVLGGAFVLGACREIGLDRL